MSTHRRLSLGPEVPTTVPLSHSFYLSLLSSVDFVVSFSKERKRDPTPGGDINKPTDKQHKQIKIKSKALLLFTVYIRISATKWCGGTCDRSPAPPELRLLSNRHVVGLVYLGCMMWVR